MTLELGLAAFSCVFALVSIALRVYRPEDLDQTLRELRRVSAELIDLDERVTTWQRRENVRRSRDKAAEAPQSEPIAEDRKAALRARLRSIAR